MVQLVGAVLLGVVLLVRECQTEQVLNILGMFPDPDQAANLWPEGYWCIPAAQLALDHINNRTVLEGYRLELQQTISGCDKDRAVIEYMKNVVLQPEERPIAILGPGCSASTLPVASLASRDTSRIVQISYGATSPSLSNIQAFPYFFRTVMPNSALSRTMVSLLQHLKWSNIATLYEDDNILRSTALNLHGEVSKSIEGGRVLHSLLVSNDTLEFDLQQIRQSNARIVFAFVGETTARDILCHALHLDMIYPRYVWVFPEHYGPFWNIGRNETFKGCTYQDLQKAANGTLGVTFRTVTTNASREIVSGMNFTQFQSQYESGLKRFVADRNWSRTVEASGQHYRTVTYDAVWALALALNDTEKILNEVHNLSLKDYREYPHLISDILKGSMEKLVEFQGTSGPVKIEDQHFSYLPVYISQAVWDGSVTYRQLGQHETNRTDIEFTEEFIWGDEPPDDEFTIRYDNPLGTALSILVIIAAIFTFILNSISMFVNYFYRFNNTIKASSPAMNWFIYSGNYFLLLGVVVYSALILNPEYCNRYYGILCNLLPWTVSIGYSLVIGTVTVKCYRIYMIFHQSNKMHTGHKMRWTLKDVTLMVILTVIIVVDVLLLISWNAAEPLLKSTYSEIKDFEGIEEIYPSCQPSWDISLYFVGAIIVYKLLLSISVTFFAWQMRSIKIKDFDNAGTAFTFLSVNLLLVIISTVIVFFLVTNEFAKRIPVLVYMIVSVSLLLFIWASILVLLGYKQKQLLTKGNDGRYVFMSTFATRGVTYDRHRGSNVSRSTVPSNLSEQFSNLSMGHEDLQGPSQE